MKLDQTLYDVAADVFESLAFMLLMPDDTIDTGDVRASAVRVDFSGPFAGQLFLRVPEATLSALATNMIGLPVGETPSAAQQRDALREVANVITGNLLPKVASREAVFAVHAPDIVSDGAIPAACGAGQGAAHAKIVLDEGFAELALFIPESVVDKAAASS